MYLAAARGHKEAPVSGQAQGKGHTCFVRGTALTQSQLWKATVNPLLLQ